MRRSFFESSWALLGRVGLLSSVALALACKPAPSSTAARPEDAAAAAPAKDLAQILAESALPAVNDAPLAGDDMAVTVHRLQNGMTVYISSDRQQPRISAWIGVRTGSRNDPPASTGLAHYLEHMLFKGSDELGTLDYAAEKPHLDRVAALYAELRGADAARRAQLFAEIDAQTQAAAAYAVPNELDRLYANLGIEGVNAFTSEDATAYIADVPSNRFTAWAEVEAERLSDPVFRLFYPELEAVYEEKNLSLDDPDDRVWEALTLALFPEHPYGTQPTLGLGEHLESPAYADMVDYFEGWYAPNNMAVILAGDIDAETALPVLEDTLGQIPAREIATPSAAALPPVRGRVLREVVAEGEQEVSLAWRTVGVGHADVAALTIMDRLMDSSSSGMLALELELPQKVQRAGSWPSFFNEAGFFAVHASLRQDQTHAEVEALLRGVVAKLRAGEFEAEAVDAAVLHEVMADARGLERNAARASRMLDAYIGRQPWADALAEDQAIRAVTREDVIRVANTYLGEDFVAVHRKLGEPSLPGLEKPEITPIELDISRESAFAARIEASPVTPIEPELLREGEDYVHLELPAGPLIVAHNPRNELFTLRYRFDRGHRKAPLLCVAFELLERAGAGERSAEALQRELFALGTSVNFECGAETSALELAGLDRNLERSVALVEGWLRDPSFDAGTLDKLRETILGRREDELDDPEALAVYLGDYALFGADSPWLSAPSNAAVRRASAKQLRGLAAGLLDYGHRTLYFGPRAADEVAAVVGMGKARREAGPRAPLRYRELEPGKTRIYFLNKDVAKSALTLALPQGPQPRAQIPLARYYEYYLDGDMSSLLFQELREARGLAYHSSGYVDRGVLPADDWALIGDMGTQGDKTVDALGVWAELLRVRPIDAARLANTRSALEAEYRAARVDPRWIVALVDDWDRRGEAGDPRAWEWAEIQAAGVEDVQALASAYAKAGMIVAVVGEREAVDLAALATVGEVVEVEASELVGYGAF
ncbi:insulinase family protein [Pseudenhygromyxa sp. WMMC2535]|uniref:M16 family metallopeptidase n=1 Tax=Pseudenhygromyxa sp. WMMC2535 TaxID=2712867 RepID=UPI0015550CD0|nr:M16 family metallopeptidase [Pseudenhygromyxa sp. WMMC2535]NVB36313.1 insulinase family protein [Pseudenhygromyxa sp. WMMC2535]